MGTSFCNINIHNPNGTKYETNEDLTVVNIAKEWDTLFQVDSVPDPKMMTKIAKNISTAVGSPAILVTYFDDIAMNLTVFVDGAKKGEYLLDNGFCKKSGLPQIISALKLDEKATKAFKKIIEKEPDASEVIGLISALSQIPLFMDKKMHDSGAVEIAGLSREDVIKKYTSAPKTKKASASFGEKKEAELLQEIPGVFNGYIDPKNGIFSILRPEEDGELDRGHVHCYQLIQDDIPRLEKSHDIRLNLNELSTMKNIKSFLYYQETPFQQEALLVNDDTNSIGYIAQGEKCSEYRDKILVPIEKRVLPMFQVMHVCEDPKAESPEGLVSYNQYDARYLVREGDYYKEIRKEREFEPTGDFFEDNDMEYSGPNSFYADAEGVVRVGMIVDYKKVCRHVRVDFYDHDYTLRETTTVPITGEFNFNSVWSGYVYNREKNLIFIGGYGIDLSGKKIRAIGELPEKLRRKIFSCFLFKNQAGKTMIAVILDKIIYILDEDLKLVYHVKSSDRIYAYYCDKKGSIIYVTLKNYWDMPYENYKADSRIRLYKLEVQ